MGAVLAAVAACVGWDARAMAQDHEEEPRGWLALTLGSRTGHDHPYQLDLDVRAGPGLVSQSVETAMPLCELAALEIEWGMALTDPSGVSEERAWALGNPFVGLQTMLGTFGVSLASGDPLLSQHGDRLLLHRGGEDPWLFMHHHGAFVYDTAIGAEIGHPVFGRLVVEMRLQLAWMLGAADGGAGLGYAGTTLDVFYQYGVARIGMEQHVASFTDDRSVESAGGYLGLDLDGLEVRLGVTRSAAPGSEPEWTGRLGIGGSFE